MECDILAFGVHPDDIEIGIGGLLISEARRGARIVMVDLTLGEMASNGTPEARRNESIASACLMGVAERINLEMKDRCIKNDDDSVFQIVSLIRRLKPKRLFYPYSNDRHPDHGNGALLIREACWSSGLVKFDCEERMPYRPDEVYMYYINDVADVTVTYDISNVYDLKLDALRCHASQFGRNGSENETYLNSGFLDVIKARDRYFGYLAGTLYVECLTSVNLPKIHGFGVDKSCGIL